LAQPAVARLLNEEFVACLVNNRGDAGAAEAGGPGGGENDVTLALFGEASLANPVLRFVDAAGNQLGPRMASAWDESIKDARGPSAAAVFLAATAALAATGRPLPRWVKEQLAALQSAAEL
jgi:hypothetical protein